MQGKTIRMQKGETLKVTNLWAAETEKRGATVTDSDWETTAGSLASAALSGSTASVLLTEAGCAVLKNTVTLSTGETLVNERIVAVAE